MREEEEEGYIRLEQGNDKIMQPEATPGNAQHHKS
jgi:hypothetical protein